MLELDSGLATLLGAVVGGLAAFAGSAWAQRKQERLDAARWRRGREDYVSREIVRVFQELSVEIASALHGMLWLLWLADEKPDALTEERIRAYDVHINGILPKIIGAHAVLASLDPVLAEDLSAFKKEIMNLDWRVSRACLDLESRRAQVVEELQELFTYAGGIERGLSGSLSALLAERLRQRARNLD